jgi:hypothetical protein
LEKDNNWEESDEHDDDNDNGDDADEVDSPSTKKLQIDDGLFIIEEKVFFGSEEQQLEGMKELLPFFNGNDIRPVCITIQLLGRLEESSSGITQRENIANFVLELIPLLSFNQLENILKFRLITSLQSMFRCPRLCDKAFSILIALVEHSSSIKTLVLEESDLGKAMTRIYLDCWQDDLSVATKLSSLLPQLLCKYTEKPPIDLVRPWMPLILLLLKSDLDEDHLVRCYGLCSLIASREDSIWPFLSLGYLPVLLQALKEKASSAPIMTRVLKILATLTAGTDEQMGLAVDSDLLSRVVPLLRHEHPKVNGRACWLISNVMAGSQELIQMVIDLHLLEFFMEELRAGRSSAPFREKAIHCLLNVSQQGSQEQIEFVLSLGILELLAPMLAPDSGESHEMVLFVVESLYDIARSLRQVSVAAMDDYYDLLIDAGIEDHIEYFSLLHPNHAILQTSQILLSFLQQDEELGDFENDPPRRCITEG